MLILIEHFKKSPFKIRTLVLKCKNIPSLEENVKLYPTMLIIFFLFCAQGFEQGLLCQASTLPLRIPRPPRHVKTILRHSHSCLACDLPAKSGPNDIFDLYVQIYKQLNF